MAEKWNRLPGTLGKRYSVTYPPQIPQEYTQMGPDEAYFRMLQGQLESTLDARQLAVLEQLIMANRFNPDWGLQWYQLFGYPEKLNNVRSD